MRAVSSVLGYLRYPIVLLSLAVGLIMFVPFLVLVSTSWTEGSFLGFPPTGFSLKWYEAVLSDKRWTQPFVLSVIVATIASAVAVVIGTLGAVAVTRLDARAAAWLRTLFIVPIALPPIAYAVGLYGVSKRIDLLDGTLVALVAGEALIAVPYVFVLVSSGVSRMDPSLVKAAATLGAHWTLILRRIELPVLVPNVIAGAIFAFNVVFDEVVLSVFLAPAGQQTFQIKLLTASREAFAPQLTAASTMVSLLALLVLGLFTFATRIGARRPRKGVTR
jgi:putative spermidine/putrescine transport system permease protein